MFYQHGITGNDPKGDSKNPNDPDLRESPFSKLTQWILLLNTCRAGVFLAHQSGKWWKENYKRGGFTHGMTRGYPQKQRTPR